MYKDIPLTFSVYLAAFHLRFCEPAFYLESSSAKLSWEGSKVVAESKRYVLVTAD